MQVEDSAAGHNAVWRSYDLTDAYNSGDFSKWVASGKFTNIFPGCYIRKTKTVDGVTYTDHIDIIVECDPYYGKWNGYNGPVTTHHVGIMPYEHLGKSCMNLSDTSEGGFVKSYMYTVTLPKYLSGYIDSYGFEHILIFGVLLSRYVSNTAVAPGCSDWVGTATDWEWYQTQIILLSEVQAYGSSIWSGSFDMGDGNSQLAAYRINQQLLHFLNESWWLRGITSATTFAYSNGGGNANTTGASIEEYVRPLLLLY